uniref:Glutaredoxin-like protein n=1 Tax=Octactis speculum TaxID=3111310 RepID=A0A7S2BKA5_9STRA
MASKGLKYVRMILVSFLVSFHVSVESSPNRVGHNFRHSQLARRVAAGLPFFKINKDEDPRLIMFFNPEDEQCPVMTAMIEEIEEDFDQKILKLDVNKNVNAWLYQELQPSAGNGRLPFFLQSGHTILYHRYFKLSQYVDMGHRGCLRCTNGITS